PASSACRAVCTARNCAASRTCVPFRDAPFSPSTSKTTTKCRPGSVPSIAARSSSRSNARSRASSGASATRSQESSAADPDPRHAVVPQRRDSFERGSGLITMTAPIRVLVVDDALDYGEMVVQFLRASGEWTGASMDIAATYDNALTALTTGHYDVAFVDYWLGARDGVALLTDVRARGIDTPIVILTAYGAEDVAVNAMKAGAADYLPKTHVSVESLDRAIRHALALRDKERQRSQAEHALRESEERFRALVENSSDALLLVDGQGRIRYGAPSAVGHFGGPPDEVIDRSLFDVVHPEDRDPIAGAMSGPLADAGESTTVEIRVQHADGGYRTLEAVAVNHIDDPAVGAIVVNARDITERRRLERQL